MMYGNKEARYFQNWDTKGNRGPKTIHHSRNHKPAINLKLFHALLVLFLLAPATYQISPNTPPTAKTVENASMVNFEAKIASSTDRQTLQKYIESQARLFGINPDLADCIVTHESQWIPDKIGPETKGKSQGLWQIYNLAHPDITQAQALDPIWATHWALTQIKNGYVRWWSTYSAPPYYCKDIPVFL